ncbi:MAG TPA: glycosyltransferase, partial [Acidimicrobiales bacterium]
SGPIVGGAALRVVAAVVLVPTAGLVGAMSATVAAEAISTLGTMMFLARLPVRADAGSLQPRRGDVGQALGTQLGLWVLATLGVVLGRHLVEAETSGRLAAAATVTSFALFMPMALAGAMLPRFAAGDGGRTLHRSLQGAAALGLAIVVGFATAGQQMVVAVAGADVRPPRWMLVELAVTVATLGVTAVAAQFLLSRRHPASLTPWLSVLVLATASLVLRPSAAIFVASLAVATVLTALVIVHIALRVDSTSTASASRWTRAPAEIDLSIVLPSHNNADRLRGVVDQTVAVLDRCGLCAEVIVVLDGSTDGSASTLRGVPESVRVLELATNQGKGAALRHGYFASRGHMVGYVDGDGDIDPAVIERLVAELQQHGAWCAVGSKFLPGADVQVTRARALLSALHRTVVAQLFRLEVKDTQCGAKLFRRDALEVLLPHAEDRRFALDLELLALGSRLGLGSVVEVPVRLHRDDSARSHVTGRAVLRTALDILRLWTRIASTPMTVARPGTEHNDPFDHLADHRHVPHVPADLVAVSA